MKPNLLKGFFGKWWCYADEVDGLGIGDSVKEAYDDWLSITEWGRQDETTSLV